MTTYVDHVIAKRVNIYIHHMNGVVIITTTVHQMVHVFHVYPAGPETMPIQRTFLKKTW